MEEFDKVVKTLFLKSCRFQMVLFVSIYIFSDNACTIQTVLKYFFLMVYFFILLSCNQHMKMLVQKIRKKNTLILFMTRELTWINNNSTIIAPNIFEVPQENIF